VEALVEVADGGEGSEDCAGVGVFRGLAVERGEASVSEIETRRDK